MVSRQSKRKKRDTSNKAVKTTRATMGGIAIQNSCTDKTIINKKSANQNLGNAVGMNCEVLLSGGVPGIGVCLHIKVGETW